QELVVLAQIRAYAARKGDAAERDRIPFGIHGADGDQPGGVHPVPPAGVTYHGSPALTGRVIRELRRDEEADFGYLTGLDFNGGRPLAVNTQGARLRWQTDHCS